jgi:hypothetical protein
MWSVREHEASNHVENVPERKKEAIIRFLEFGEDSDSDSGGFHQDYIESIIGVYFEKGISKFTKVTKPLSKLKILTFIMLLSSMILATEEMFSEFVNSEREAHYLEAEILGRLNPL